MKAPTSNILPAPDPLLVELADYVLTGEPGSEEAYETARDCLLDALGCAILALNYPACTNLLGPIVPGAVLANGARVPGTGLGLDPITAAFGTGCVIRWLDFNDTWLAAEWGHPSDNLGAILALADYLSRNGRPVLVRDVLTAMIKAHEIQGVLALTNSFNRVGLDHVLLVRIASTAVATAMLGGTRDQVINALSNAWADGGALRVYRHAPNTGSRKSWAAGDATSRAVWHAFVALRNEPGYPGVLSTPTWGFCDALFRAQPITLARPLGSYVMENVLFKVSFPAEFHAQSAVEAAMALHPVVTDRLNDVARIEITTQEAAVRIIDKTGPLHNPADRDHCLQYMVAVGLIFGELTADHYEEETAGDPRIDALRATMVVREDLQYSRDYLDPTKRSIANAVQIFFNDGTQTERVAVEYPIGHRLRRAEARPLLRKKFTDNLSSRLSAEAVARIVGVCDDADRGESLSVSQLLDLLVCE